MSVIHQHRPNILLIICHDLGRFLGCYGVSTLHTPHLDALAADGVLFTRAFCTAPQCSPSRASLFTGRYPHNNGVMGLSHANFAWDLNPQERHLGQELQSAGYTTALIGVHHESRLAGPERVAERCGMDRRLPGRRGEEVSDRALECLADFADQEHPFYLQLGYTEPHRLRVSDQETRDYQGFLGDYMVPDDESGVTIPPYLRNEPSAREEMAELQGAVRYLDGQVGRVLEGLRAHGLEENTLVIFTTDHGLALPRAKCSLYDPGLETALIMRLPTREWRGGRTHDALISNLDIFPTVLEVVGVPVSNAVQGRSFLPLLDGEEYHYRDRIYCEFTYHDYYDPRRCIRRHRHKLILRFCAAPAFMDPTQSWRPRTTPVATIKGRSPYLELYDLETDPLELHDLADEPGYADIQSELLSQLYEWMLYTDDPLLEGAVTSPMHNWAVEALASTSIQPENRRETE